jgi:hypothetical protein
MGLLDDEVTPIEQVSTEPVNLGDALILSLLVSFEGGSWWTSDESVKFLFCRELEHFHALSDVEEGVVALWSREIDKDVRVHVDDQAVVGFE